MLTSASATRTVAFVTLIAPFPPSRSSRCSGPSHYPLQLECQEFVLGWRQAKPADVADGALLVDQQNDRILSVEQLFQPSVQSLRVTTERLSEGHRSQLRGGAASGDAGEARHATPRVDGVRPRQPRTAHEATLSWLANDARPAHASAGTSAPALGYRTRRRLPTRAHARRRGDTRRHRRRSSCPVEGAARAPPWHRATPPAVH